MHIGNIPERPKASCSHDWRSQVSATRNRHLSNIAPSTILPKFHLRWFACGTILVILLLTSVAAHPRDSDGSDCGNRFSEMIARQQSAAQNAAEPCRAAAERDAPVRHHDDAAAFDASGGPAIFGSVAIPVHRTPFDARLRKLSPTALAGGGPWSSAIAQARRMDRIGQLEHVSRWVNNHLGYASDQSLDGRPDLWSPAAVTLTRGRGDCEDYAIAKMALLASMGFRAEDLFLVLVRDGARRSDHAILAVREGGRFLVLDSTTNEVRESGLVPDYFPVMSFAAGRAWLHGYPVKRPLAPLRVATAAEHSDWNDRGR